jgi:flagellar motility protein MotE (MotC chaperone)
MRWIRLWVVAGLVVKAAVAGVWWWTSVPPSRAAAAAETPGTPGAVPSELLAKSRGFRDLLEAVRQRGAELDRREQEVVAREAALRTLEQTLGEDGGHAETRPGATPAAAPAPAPAAAEESPPCSPAVTKIYQSMKPEEAAPILDRLDDTTTKAIFACMKEKQIGALLAAMNRDRAVALTRALAGMPAP